MVKGNPLERRSSRVCLGQWKGSGQEPKPLELYRGHEESIRHEPRQALKVEWRQRGSRRTHLPDSWRLFLVQVMNFNRNEVIATLGSSLLRASLDGRDHLRNGIGDATQHLDEPVSLSATVPQIQGTKYCIFRVSRRLTALVTIVVSTVASIVSRGLHRTGGGGQQPYLAFRHNKC